MTAYSFKLNIYKSYVEIYMKRFQVFTAETMKLPCSGIFLHSVLQLLVTANVAPNSLIFVTLMTEALRSCETRFL
jgi:hypothetical protein